MYNKYSSTYYAIKKNLGIENVTSANKYLKHCIYEGNSKNNYTHDFFFQSLKN